MPDMPSVMQPFHCLAVPGMFAQLGEGTARCGWMLAWNNACLKLGGVYFFLGGENRICIYVLGEKVICI